MSTPTATPRTDDEETPLITNHRVSAETYKRMVDLARELETELACEKENRNHLIEKGAKLETELAAAKAEAAHYMSIAQKATDEHVRLRADLERFTGHGLLDCHAICDQRDAAIARAERAEAERDALAKDKARLDWLSVSDAWFDYPATGAFTPDTMRAAIDAAMKP